MGINKNMSFLSLNEIWSSAKFLFLCGLGLFILVVPHNYFLPITIDYLYNKSLLTYFYEHTTFFLSIIPLIMIVAVGLVLWRKK